MLTDLKGFHILCQLLDALFELLFGWGTLQDMGRSARIDGILCEKGCHTTIVVDVH